jgi:hypothetical protein
MTGYGEGDEMRERAGIPEALRQLLSPPGGEEYWAGLEARIMRGVKAAGVIPVQDWRTVLAAWARPAIAAAAALLLAAGALVVHTQREQQRRAYESLLATTSSVPVEAAVRPTLQNDRDATLRFLLAP